MSIIKDELLEVKEKHGDKRRSRIEFSGGELSIEDMIPDEKSCYYDFSCWLY